MTTQMNFKLTVLLFGFALISFAVCTNISYAQLLQPGAQPPSPSSPPSRDKGVLPNAALSPTIRAVNITSPTKHQQVPIGKDLTILGTSIGNSTSNCQIIVGLNNIKPYPSAIGNGPGGVKDYSKWSFILTSKYAAIKQGPDNKITARYKCSGDSSNINPNIVPINSVNVTGVATITTTTTTNQSQQQQANTGIPWLP